MQNVRELQNSLFRYRSFDVSGPTKLAELPTKLAIEWKNVTKTLFKQIYKNISKRQRIKKHC